MPVKIGYLLFVMSTFVCKGARSLPNLLDTFSLEIMCKITISNNPQKCDIFWLPFPKKIDKLSTKGGKVRNSLNIYRVIKEKNLLQTSGVPESVICPQKRANYSGDIKLHQGPEKSSDCLAKAVHSLARIRSAHCPSVRL